MTGSRRQTAGLRPSAGPRLLVGAVMAAAAAGAVLRVTGDQQGAWLMPIFLLTGTCYLVVGILIIERRPGNLVGPLVLALGLVLAGYIALDAFVHQPGTPSVEAAALVVSLIDGPLFVMVAALFLVFPDGHLPGPRWRVVVIGEAGLAAIVLLGALLRPGPFPYYTWLDNPIGPPPNPITEIWELAYGLMVLGVGVAALSLVGRWRRASLVERAQLKWVAAAAALVALAMVTYGGTAGPAQFSEAGDLAVGVTLGLFPIAIGIAVLRYRLYEIDRLISRTVGWALVTAILAAVFVGVIVGLQAVLAPVTEENTLAVAASTLVAATLFQPLRAFVQRAVDRRFDRARVSGERVVSEFAAHARDETDLARLQGAVLCTARASVGPSRAGIWLRGDR